MKSVVSAAVLCAVLLAALSLRAVIMRSLPIEELSRAADLIVQGVVTNKVCLRDDQGRIYTRVDLQISDVMKGVAGNANTLSVVHGGGTVGNERQEVSGQVEYAVGEEVVAFLVMNPHGQPVTIGLCQGKFEVWQNKQTGEKFAYNLFHGSPPVEKRSDAFQKAAAESSTPLKLTDFKQQIEQASK